MNKKEAVIYSNPECEACKAVVQSLQSSGHDVITLDIDDAPRAALDFIRDNQNSAVPAICINGEYYRAREVLTW